MIWRCQQNILLSYRDSIEDSELQKIKTTDDETFLIIGRYYYRTSLSRGLHEK